jgi:mRNA interferase MazF
LTRRRGGVYYAELDGIGRKPVLVVSWNAINDGLRQPICVLITRNPRDRTLPTYVPIEPEESGLSDPSYALCHGLITLREDDLDPAPIGHLPPWKMAEVERALRQALDLDSPTT